MEGFSTLLFGVAMIAVFYFILIRPERKKKKALEEMRNNLAPGVEITTIGGIVGTVVYTKDNVIVIETSADRVRLQIAKWAVGSIGVQTAENQQNTNKGSKEALPEGKKQKKQDGIEQEKQEKSE